MSKLSSGFLGAEAAAGASTAFESALMDLKEKYDKKAADEAAAPPCADCATGTCAAGAGAPAAAGHGGGAVGHTDGAAGEDEEDNEWLDDPELEKIRMKRLAELKEKVAKRKEHLALGHGEYREIVEEEFLKEVTSSDLVVCHFFHHDFERCKILDHHLRLLAPRHVQTKFVKLNAEKAPFFITKLAVRVLPSMIVFKEGIAKARMTGFDRLSGDEFRTKELEKVLRGMGAFQADAGKPGSRRDDDDDTDSDDDGELEERREGATVAEILEQRRARVIKSMLAEDLGSDGDDEE